VRSPRKWFFDIMSKGGPPVVDEDEIVEAGFVDLPAGPMVMARIHEAGIRAESADTRVNPYMAGSMTRIVCRAGDLQRVQQIIEDVTGA
jgi:hypothetical protein